jgi:hypothetical protein
VTAVVAGSDRFPGDEGNIANTTHQHQGKSNQIILHLNFQQDFPNW